MMVVNLENGGGAAERKARPGGQCRWPAVGPWRGWRQRRSATGRTAQRGGRVGWIGSAWPNWHSREGCVGTAGRPARPGGRWRCTGPGWAATHGRMGVGAGWGSGSGVGQPGARRREEGGTQVLTGGGRTTTGGRPEFGEDDGGPLPQPVHEISWASPSCEGRWPIWRVRRSCRGLLTSGKCAG
ncbi:hypothetical protein SEVIR_3G368075v4 [Setaria viridis]